MDGQCYSLKSDVVNPALTMDGMCSQSYIKDHISFSQIGVLVCFHCLSKLHISGAYLE